MITLLVILQLFVTIALIAAVLVQRSEGGGLGIGSSQGMGAFMTGRGTATLLTRATSILAGIFMALCLILAVLNRGASSGAGGKDILAQPSTSQSPAPAAPAKPN
jgi:preprotein translocase subunit SecG